MKFELLSNLLQNILFLLKLLICDDNFSMKQNEIKKDYVNQILIKSGC